MSFSEKLDFLLNITNIPNSILARALSLDPSYISRLRSGKRSVPHENYLRTMAAFFSKHCMKDYILSALAASIKQSNVRTVTDNEELTDILFQWLNSQDNDNNVKVQTLLSDFARPSSEDISRQKAAQREAQGKSEPELRTFFGAEGRRQATLSLFYLALQQPHPKTLLLYSDENSSWMVETPSFYQEWSTLLWQIILKGYQIKVIHKVSRDIDEMLDVIHQWLPFYTSGAVEPYYYPRLRDGVYKRTLSVIPGTAAIFATSIGESIETTANFMSTDKVTVDSFTNEFYSYLTLCKPLIHIQQAENPFSLLPTLFAFQVKPGNLIFQTASLGMITMPPAVGDSLLMRYSQIDPAYLNTQKQWTETFEQKLKKDVVYHILRLQSADNVCSAQSLVGTSYALENANIYYTPEEYRLHLQNILRLLSDYENYHVVISANEPDAYSLYCIEDGGVMLFKEDTPPILFKITEPNMVSAFWDYMIQQQNVTGRSSLSRSAAIRQIQILIDELDA